MPNALNTPITTNPSTVMNMQELMTMPFIQALSLILKGAVEEYLTENGLLAAIANAARKDRQNEPESLDTTGALEFLNANGYPISKGQLYKETSNGTIPHWKFNNKLHFKESELLSWAESRLVNGKAVGVLNAEDRSKKKGGSR